jgi:hypothetical protein
MQSLVVFALSALTNRSAGAAKQSGKVSTSDSRNTFCHLLHSEIIGHLILQRVMLQEQNRSGSTVRPKFAV